MARMGLWRARRTICGRLQASAPSRPDHRRQGVLQRGEARLLGSRVRAMLCSLAEGSVAGDGCLLAGGEGRVRRQVSVCTTWEAPDRVRGGLRGGSRGPGLRRGEGLWGLRQRIFCPVFAQSAMNCSSPLSVRTWLASALMTAGGAVMTSAPISAQSLTWLAVRMEAARIWVL
jgi:hypothetical protein